MPVDRSKIGWVRFWSADPPLLLNAQFAEGGPVPVWSTGWAVVQRPRRRSITEWQGTDPLRIDLKLLIDSFQTNEGVETEASCRTLERMSGLDQNDPEPPVLIVNAEGAIPHDYHEASHVRWVIEKLTWGDSLRNYYGNRIRQYVDVTIMQYIADELLEQVSVARKRNSGPSGRRNTGRLPARARNVRKPGASSKRYTVKAGDTLSKIAAAKLGSWKRWKEIAKLNNIRDPRKLRVGQVLRLP